MHRADPRAGQHGNRSLGNIREIDDDPIAFFDFVPLQHIREAANFVMQLLVGKRTSVTRFAFPDNCRLVPARTSQMAIQTIFRDVEFAADEPLRKGRFPFQDPFPFGAPDQLARFSSPELCRLLHRFSIHSAILSETFDSRVFREVSCRLENALLDQMRLDIGLHEQSLICRRIFQGKRAVAAVLKRLKTGCMGYNGRRRGPRCNYVTLLTVVRLRMLEPPNDEFFMREALRLAKKAAEAGEVPVGAIVVRAGKIIARASNQVELLKDATAHAEMLVLTQAEAAVGDWRLTGCDIYVTKEPCAMCAGALVHTRIQRVIFGCTDPSAGAAGSVINLLQMPGFNHRCDIASGVLQNECAAILQDFFRRRRNLQIDTPTNQSAI